jgi:hypothetical protein
MGEKIGISGPKGNSTQSIKYEDVFNMKELYKAIRDWLITNQYVDAKSSEKMEKFYLEKHNVNGTREIWVWWRTDRSPHGSKYFRYHMNVDYHVLNMKDVEIMFQGQKIKAQKGEVEVMINCYLQTEAEFEIKKTFLWFLANYFRRKTYKKEIEVHKADLKEDFEKLQSFIKQFLELKSFLPKTEMFYPARGLA